MLRKAIENRVGHLSNAEFEIVCEITSDDIKFNMINFKKRTSLDYLIGIAVRAAEIFKRCA